MKHVQRVKRNTTRRLSSFTARYPGFVPITKRYLKQTTTETEIGTVTLPPRWYWSEAKI